MLSCHCINLLSSSEFPVPQKVGAMLTIVEQAAVRGAGKNDQDVGIAISQDSNLW